MMNNPPLSQAQFAGLISHSGAMLLIDEVISWNEEKIITRCQSHRKTDNPLRLAGQLSALHLIEYGAQTMAVHCGLLTGQARPGFLAAVRSAHFYRDDLTSLQTDLIIQATAQLQLANGAVYHLIIADTENTLLLDAWATVIHI